MFRLYERKHIDWLGDVNPPAPGTTCSVVSITNSIIVSPVAELLNQKVEVQNDARAVRREERRAEQRESSRRYVHSHSRSGREDGERHHRHHRHHRSHSRDRSRSRSRSRHHHYYCFCFSKDEFSCAITVSYYSNWIEYCPSCKCTLFC